MVYHFVIIFQTGNYSVFRKVYHCYCFKKVLLLNNLILQKDENIVSICILIIKKIYL